MSVLLAVKLGLKNRLLHRLASELMPRRATAGRRKTSFFKRLDHLKIDVGFLPPAHSSLVKSKNLDLLENRVTSFSDRR